jgi:hypothetical protein
MATDVKDCVQGDVAEKGLVELIFEKLGQMMLQKTARQGC